MAKRITTVFPFTISENVVQNTEYFKSSFSTSHICNKPSSSEMSEVYTNSPVYESSGPVLMWLRVVGFYYDKDIPVDNVVRNALHRIYCWAIALIIISVSLYNLLSLKDVKEVNLDMFLTFAGGCSYLLQTINVISFMVASHDNKALKKMFICFSDLSKFGGPYIDPSWLKKLAAVVCIMSCVGLAFAIMFITWMLANRSPLAFIFPKTQIAEENILLVSILSFFFEIYIVCCWISCSLLELFLAIILYKEFVLFAKSLKKKVNSSEEQIIQYFELERKRFLEMIRIVKAADRSLFLHQAACFGCNVIGLCLQLYAICYYASKIHSSAAAGFLTFGLTICVLDVAVVCTSGILITAGVSIIIKHCFNNYNITCLTDGNICEAFRLSQLNDVLVLSTH